MLSDRIRKLDDYYGHEKQSMIDFKKEGCKLRKEFVIEYCNDETKLNRLGLLPEYGGLEIDDVYHRITFKEDETETFHSFDGIAMQTFLFYMFSPRICDVKMWENTYDGTELIQERWIEFPCTFTRNLRSQIEKDLLKERDEYKKLAEEFSKNIGMYMAFLKRYNAEERFSEFKREVQGNDDT